MSAGEEVVAGAADRARAIAPPPEISEEGFLAVIWTMTSIATLFVIARAYVRVKYTRRIMLDDYLVAIACVLLLTLASLYTYGAHEMFYLIRLTAGLLPMPATEAESLAMIAKTEFFLRQSFAGMMVFWTSLWTVKASFLAFFYPLSNGLPWDRRFWWGVSTIVLLTYIAIMIDFSLVCGSDISNNFTLGKCAKPHHIKHQQLSLRMSTAFDIATDLLIMMLPWKLVLVVRKSTKEKLMIGCVIGLGIFIIIFSIIRVIITNTTQTSPSPIWIELWSGIETSVAVIVISATAFRIFVFRGDTLYAGGTASISAHSRTPQKKSSPARHFQPSIALDDRSEKDAKMTFASRTMDNDNGSEEELVHGR